MLGYERHELIDEWFPRVIPSKDKESKDIPPVESPVLKSLLSGHASTEVSSYLKKDGSLFPVSGTASPFILDGKPRGSIIVFRDVSQEMAVERAKDEFVSLASHQLRTPLTSIRLYTQMIKDDADDSINEELRSHLTKIEASTIDMLELVDDFLNISKLELGGFELTLHEIDLVEIIKDQIGRVSAISAENGIKLSFKNNSHDSVISTDLRLLSEALHNILTNSIRYRTQESPEIKITLSKKAKKILIAIKDNGIGIPAADQADVFERLYRASNAKMSQANGTGLGLYLVKKVIEASSGHIWFKSQEGVGTTFFIELPR